MSDIVFLPFLLAFFSVACGENNVWLGVEKWLIDVVGKQKPPPR